MNSEELRSILQAAPPVDREVWFGNQFGQLFGWITNPDRVFLTGFLPEVGLRQAEPLRIVEIGTFAGSTARGLIALTGGGQVVCVDDFYEFRHLGGVPGRNPGLLGHYESGRELFWLTLKNGVDLSAYASLCEAPSTAHPSCRCCPPIAPPACVGWTQPIDLLFVDGDHSYEGAAADLINWSPHVVPGGWVLVDDYNMPPVMAACRNCLALAAWERVREPSDVGQKSPPYDYLDGQIAVFRRK